MAYDVSSAKDKATPTRKKGDSSVEGTKLEELKELFTTCQDAEQDQRAQMLDDLEFARMSDQWPAEISKMRKEEGRPTITINRLPSFIRQVVNDVRQNRPQIKVKPVDGSGDRATADVFAGIIRNIETYSRSDIAYDTALDFAVSCGVGYFRIDIEYNSGYSFEKKLTIKRIPNVFSVYGDPSSKEADSSDWNKAFLVDIMPKKEFEREYKGAEPVDWENSEYTGLEYPWFEEDSILLCEAWTREKVQREIIKLSNGEIIGADEYENIKELLSLTGVTPEASRQMSDYKITQCLMTGAEILDETSWVGKYIPIIPVYGEEINVEGKRRFNSLIHNAKDAQRMFNYWRTTSTELVALAPKVPWIGEEGSFDVEGQMFKWKNSNIKSYPYLEYKKGRPPPTRQMLDSGPAAGALSEALHAADDMKAIMGMYDASLGQKSNEVSGRAIMARQREGDVSTFHFVDNLSRSIQHAGCALVDLIPKVYTGDRIMRIITEEGKQQTIKLSSSQASASGLGGSPGAAPPPVPPPQMGGPGALPPPPPGLMGGPPPMAPPAASGGPQMAPPGMPPQGMPPPDPAMQQQAQDAEKISGIFNLEVGEYDVVVDTGPSVTTRREELAIQMTEFAKVYPQILPVIGDLMIKSLDWPNADLIAERMEGAKQASQKESAVEKENQRLMLENQMLKAGIQIDQQSLSIDKFEAETKRMAALKTEPDGGPDPIDQYNADTKRLQTMGALDNQREANNINREKVRVDRTKAVLDYAKPHPPKAPPKLNNGGN